MTLQGSKNRSNQKIIENLLYSEFRPKIPRERKISFIIIFLGLILKIIHLHKIRAKEEKMQQFTWGCSPVRKGYELL